MTGSVLITPSTVDEAAAALRDADRPGRPVRPVRPVGSGSRLGWGGADTGPVIELSTVGLDRILEHNPGDFTAVLQAGVPLARAQEAFAAAGQWLALDPPPPGGTIGGVVATADSGPARHRYGAVRDLVIGATVVLSDGTVASSGGRVIKNVAGYDLGKLFAGSFGTLGLIASVAVRLHPLPAGTATLTGRTDDPAALASTVELLAKAPLEAMALDAWWYGDSGGALVRFAGAAAAAQAAHARPLLVDLSDVSIVADDAALWVAQGEAQRCPEGVVVKVSGRTTDLVRVIGAARATGARLVSRAALGLSWLALPAGAPAGDDAASGGGGDVAGGVDVAARVAAIRAAVAPRACAVLDGAALVPHPWPFVPAGSAALMRRVKARFDPAGRFRPGAFVDGI